MNENDDLLIQQFLAPLKTDEVADDGFSLRVIHALPNRRQERQSRVWTVFCLVVGALLFLFTHSWETLLSGLRHFVVDTLPQVNLVYTALTVLVLLILVFVEVIDRERAAL